MIILYYVKNKTKEFTKPKKNTLKTTYSFIHFFKYLGNLRVDKLILKNKNKLIINKK